MSLIQIPANIPVLPGCRFDGQKFIPDNHTVKRMLRTVQGSVAEYDETYPGLLVEPAATNYLLNTATPATQTTGSLAAGTYTLWIEGAGSAAVTAGTATISGNGTASAGSPNTFTVSVAGTVTVTVTDPVTFFQLEGGAFPTSKIPTTTATVTRAADNVSFATPSWLLAHPNDFAVIGAVIPGAAGQATKHIVCNYTDANGECGVFVTADAVTLRKRSGGSNTDASATYTHAASVPMQYIAYSSASLGTGIVVRAYTESAWGDWTAWGTSDAAGAKASAVIAATTRIGSQTDSAGHIYGSMPMTRILRIPTNLSAAALQAWLVTKAGE